MIANQGIGDSTVMGRKTPAGEMPRVAVMVRWVVAIAGLTLLLGLLIIRPPAGNAEFFVTFAVFTVLILAAHLFFQVRVGPGSYFSITPTFSFVYFLVSGATGAAALNALSEFLVWLFQRVRNETSRTPLYALFEVGQAILSTVAGGLAVQLVFRKPAVVEPVFIEPISSLVVFAAAQLVVTTVISSAAVYSRTGMADVRRLLWPRVTLWTTISFLVNIPFAVVLRLIAPALGYIVAALLIFAFLAGLASVVRLNVELRQGNEELKALNRIGTMINSTLDVPQLFRILARETSRVLHWDAFFIALGGRESESIDIVFMTEEGNEIAQRTIPGGAGLTGRAIQSGELVVYEQGQGSDIYDESMKGKQRPKSVVVAPMLFGSEVVGAISLQSQRTDVYGASQLRLLQIIAAQAAIAIRNAQLYTSEERANRERDEFVSLVTHEIKNPLTSINGYATVAEEALESSDRDGAAESIRVIREESKKILRLTEDLLDASKLSAGKFSIRLEEIDLRAVVESVAKKYQVTTSHPIEISVEGDLPRIDGDSTRLTQVVENLVSNAAKYSETRKPILISLEDAGDRIAMTVRDFGSGIPPAKIPLIFERFYRVEEGGESVKGTGLGLFITREIVRMHGGTITVDSKPGEGTAFRVVLPVRHAVSI